MKKTKLVFLLGIVFGIFVGLLFVTPVFTVGDIELENPLQTTDLKVILGGVIGKVLALVGSITLLVFIAGGFLWLTSAGNAEKVQVGTKTMLYAIIGLFIIFASYAIINLMIGGITGGQINTGSASESTGSEGENLTNFAKANEVCKEANKDFSCQPVSNCTGLIVSMDANKKELTKACSDATTDKCINGQCPRLADNIKCCLPKVDVTTGVATAEIVSERDVECKKEHPTWSCMDIDECNLNLTGKKTVKAKRSVCTATETSCITGKCNVGADADNLEIVCCEKKKTDAEIKGACWTEEIFSCTNNTSKSNCEGFEGTFFTNKTCKDVGLECLEDDKTCVSNQYCFLNKCLGRCNQKYDQTSLDTECGKFKYPDDVVDAVLAGCVAECQNPKGAGASDCAKVEDVKFIYNSANLSKLCKDNESHLCEANPFCIWVTDEKALEAQKDTVGIYSSF